MKSSSETSHLCCASAYSRSEILRNYGRNLPQFLRNYGKSGLLPSETTGWPTASFAFSPRKLRERNPIVSSETTGDTKHDIPASPQKLREYEGRMSRPSSETTGWPPDHKNQHPSPAFPSVYSETTGRAAGSAPRKLREPFRWFWRSSIKASMAGDPPDRARVAC